ncbi:MAG: MotA/TolQ/ExbB proton channel family protein [Planctomycetia bacterium]|nr:MotA/TolQ/ExbB proton channel family protein [Planctomycetia bacterium]
MWEAYRDSLNEIDWCIIICGCLLLLIQMFFLVCRGFMIRWATQDLEKYQLFFGMLMELFPLAGLLGTVFALLQTFGTISGTAMESIDIHAVIKNFAPALTTTASGIMALMANLVLNAVLWCFIPAKNANP